MGSSGIQEDFEPYHELNDGLLCIMAIILQTEIKLRYFIIIIFISLFKIIILLKV